MFHARILRVHRSLWQNGFNGISPEIFWCYDYIGGLFCSWAPPTLYNWCSKTWRALPEIASTCCGPPADIDWNQSWHTVLHVWHRRIDQQLEYHGLKCGQRNRLVEPKRWKAWTPIFSMANSTTKFLPLASLRHLAWHRPQHWSLVPVLRADFISFVQPWCCFHVFMYSLYIQCFCVSLPVP